MAKYILAVGVVQFFGSKGGATFQKSGKVFSVRKRNAPIQKKTIKQSQARNRFGSKAQNWRDLTLVQKSNFGVRAAQYARVDSLGNTYYQSGQNMQLGCNVLRSLTNRTDLTVVGIPAAFTTIAEDTFSMDISLVAMDVVILPVTVQAGFDIIIFGSAPILDGLEPSSVPMKNFGLLTQNQNSASQNFFTRYTNVFGSVDGSAGLFIYLRLDLIQNNSGQLRQTLYGKADITA